MPSGYTAAMHKLLPAFPILTISLAALALAACGSSSTTSPTGASATGAPTATPTAAPTPTATAAAVGITCPSEATLNAALGFTLTTLRQEPTTGLAAGDTGESCQYTSATVGQVAILDLGTGPVQTNFIALVEAGEQKAATAQGAKYTVTGVPGVGTKADFITFAKAGSPSEDGILAETGSGGIVVTVIPPVSESQLEAFASQLLG
jgi:hypothetical protein